MGHIYGWSEPAKEKGVDFCARSLKNHDFAKSFGSIFLPFSSCWRGIWYTENEKKSLHLAREREIKASICIKKYRHLSLLYTSIGPSYGKVWDFFALRALKITIFLGF